MSASDEAILALGRVPSGLFILTAGNGPTETGLLASWVQQCSFDPPRLTGPFEPLPADPDAISHGPAIAENEVEKLREGIDHDGTGNLNCRKINFSAPVFPWHLLDVIEGDAKSFIDVFDRQGGRCND